jgi:hypothetical protein
LSFVNGQAAALAFVLVLLLAAIALFNLGTQLIVERIGKKAKQPPPDEPEPRAKKRKPTE